MEGLAVTLDFKALRKACGYPTQASFAVEVGCSPNTVIWVEKYHHKPSYGLRKRMARALGRDPTLIWPDHEDTD